MLALTLMTTRERGSGKTQRDGLTKQKDDPEDDYTRLVQHQCIHTETTRQGRSVIGSRRRRGSSPDEERIMGDTRCAIEDRPRRSGIFRVQPKDTAKRLSLSYRLSIVLSTDGRDDSREGEEPRRTDATRFLSSLYKLE